MLASAVKQPAQHEAASFADRRCGALSVPQNQRVLPLVAAATSALRCSSACEAKGSTAMSPRAVVANEAVYTPCGANIDPS